MSAWLVSNKHLNVMVGYFSSNITGEGCYLKTGENDYTYVSPDTAQKVFDILLKANVDSLQARYEGELYAATAAKDYEMTLVPQHLLKEKYSVADIAKLLDCYEYQACETEDYFGSIAAGIVASCRKHLLSSLEGYEEAEWGLE